MLGFLISLTASSKPQLYLQYKIKIGELVGLHHFMRDAPLTSEREQ
jgi:hypothetical protein